MLLNNILANDIVLTGNDIWIATSGVGLIRYDRTNRTTKSFTTQSGLPSNYVNSLLQEGDCLWLGTENGLCRFSTADRSVYTYANNYPLSGLSFNPNSCGRLRDGNLIFGTNKGAVMLNPGMIGQNSSQARIFFQDITVSGSSIRENDPLPAPVPVNKYTELALNYKQNNFILELISTGMYNTGVKFSWKMEGIDQDWSPPADLRFITYTNLPGGKFRLNIRMYDNSLSRILDERVLNIQVVPPFWETWWFHLLSLLLALGLIFYGLRAYSNHLKQKHVRDKIRFLPIWHTIYRLH
ncbi:MAG: hypothetical protein LUE93_12220 [Bacteroides sp.]|nr:hypothetical protein [Bacteroides sp.]